MNPYPWREPGDRSDGVKTQEMTGSRGWTSAGVDSPTWFVLASGLGWINVQASGRSQQPRGDELDPMNEQTVSLRNPAWAAFLAWLVPGLGHFYQGRTGKGILYAVCILGLYLMGMVMGEGKIVYWRWVNPLNNPEKFCLYYLGQFFVGLPALPAADPEHAPALRPGPDSLGFHGGAVTSMS